MVEKYRSYKDLKTGNIYFIRELDIIFKNEPHAIIVNIYTGEARLTKLSILEDSKILKDDKEVSRFKLLIKKK